jgi:hypothetical protein
MSETRHWPRRVQCSTVRWHSQSRKMRRKYKFMRRKTTKSCHYNKKQQMWMFVNNLHSLNFHTFWKELPVCARQIKWTGHLTSFVKHTDWTAYRYRRKFLAIYFAVQLHKCHNNPNHRKHHNTSVIRVGWTTAVKLLFAAHFTRCLCFVQQTGDQGISK